MEKLKIYIGLIAIWGLVIWLAFEFTWDAWKNAKRSRSQRRSSVTHQLPSTDETITRKSDSASKRNQTSA